MTVKQKAAALVFAALMSVNVCAFAQGSFLCMRNGETTAIANDENGDLKYIELKDSKGAIVAPQISSDGNTYLPFRYICDISGIGDGNSIAGTLPDNCYRFVNTDIYGDKDKIEINCNGVYYSHNIGESFEYIASDGSRRSVAIYNIRGTLYAPMGYLAVLTGSHAAWNENYAQIMFVGKGLESRDFLGSDNMLRRDKQMRLGYDVFGNNLVNSSLYLKTDGMTIADLSKELPGTPSVRSISRSGADIYYIDENDTLNIVNENSREIRRMHFTDEAGEAVEVLCASAFVLKNKLYGIKTDAAGETDGRLFYCNTDGSGFKYLTENKVFNLTVKNNMLDYYLFYCDAQTRSTLHMIRLNTMDDYEVQITDFEHRNLLSDIKQLAVGVRTLYYLDNSGYIHVIDLEWPLEQVTIARLNDAHTIHMNGVGGDMLNNITSMNYDHVNDVLYIVQKGFQSRIYCFSPLVGKFVQVSTADVSASGLSLFLDGAYKNRMVAVTEGGIYSVTTEYGNGTVAVTE